MKNELLDRMTGELTFITDYSKKEVMDLYLEVNDFVVDNYLCDGHNEFYYLKYNNRYFQVGYTYGPEALYYVRTVKNNDEVTCYVDYEMMKNHELTPSELETKNMIEEIHESVNKLKEKGVSLQLINKTFYGWR